MSSILLLFLCLGYTSWKILFSMYPASIPCFSSSITSLLIVGTLLTLVALDWVVILLPPKRKSQSKTNRSETTLVKFTPLTLLTMLAQRRMWTRSLEHPWEIVVFRDASHGGKVLVLILFVALATYWNSRVKVINNIFVLLLFYGCCAPAQWYVV